MPIVNVYIDDATASRLHKASLETGISQADICESAVSETLLDNFRHRKDDPGRSSRSLPGNEEAGK